MKKLVKIFPRSVLVELFEGLSVLMSILDVLIGHVIMHNIYDALQFSPLLCIDSLRMFFQRQTAKGRL